jgi:hypothetical protein
MNKIVYNKAVDHFAIGFLDGEIPSYGYTAWNFLCRNIFTTFPFRTKKFLVIGNYIFYPVPKRKLFEIIQEIYIDKICKYANRELVAMKEFSDLVYGKQMEIDF